MLALRLDSTSLHERLATFRRTHVYKELDVRGVRWRYLVSGQGTRTLLLPSGGTRMPDMYLLLFEALEPEFRILAPAYPPLPTMAGLVDGVAGIVDAEGLAQVDVLGSSFGGFVAQCFVRRYPSRVRRLLLANTGAPGTSPLPALGLLVRLCARLPEPIVRWGPDVTGGGGLSHRPSSKSSGGACWTSSCGRSSPRRTWSRRLRKCTTTVRTITSHRRTWSTGRGECW